MPDPPDPPRLKRSHLPPAVGTGLRAGSAHQVMRRRRWSQRAGTRSSFLQGSPPSRTHNDIELLGPEEMSVQSTAIRAGHFSIGPIFAPHLVICFRGMNATHTIRAGTEEATCNKWDPPFPRVMTAPPLSGPVNTGPEFQMDGSRSEAL